MGEKICAKCGQERFGDFAKIYYGELIDVKTGSEGVSSKYRILGSEKIYICESCFSKRLNFGIAELLIGIILLVFSLSAIKDNRVTPLFFFLPLLMMLHAIFGFIEKEARAKIAIKTKPKPKPERKHRYFVQSDFIQCSGFKLPSAISDFKKWHQQHTAKSGKDLMKQITALHCLSEKLVFGSDWEKSRIATSLTGAEMANIFDNTVIMFPFIDKDVIDSMIQGIEVDQLDSMLNSLSEKAETLKYLVANLEGTSLRKIVDNVPRETLRKVGISENKKMG